MPWAWGASFLLAQEGLGDTAICWAQRQTVSPCWEGGLCQQTEVPRLNVAWAGRAWGTCGGKTERGSSERRLLALCSGSWQVRCVQWETGEYGEVVALLKSH